MSHALIARSTDLKKLRDEGYSLAIIDGNLVVDSFPYVGSDRIVHRGKFVTHLTLAGDVTAAPDDHVGYFIGDHPCDTNGNPIEKIRHTTGEQVFGPNLTINHSFSAKPVPTQRYADYYEKVTTYEAIIAGCARQIDPSVTAKVFEPILVGENEPNEVHRYIDTSSSRAGIGMAMSRIAGGVIGIVGVGGTGSYILDLVVKCPVAEIHLFDGDTFYQHNAFRFPGAATVDDLQLRLKKTTFLTERYSQLHTRIIDHPYMVGSDELTYLEKLSFVFISVDSGASRRMISEYLDRKSIPYIDCGIGVNISSEGRLFGAIRTSRCTTGSFGQLHRVANMSEVQQDGLYNTAIQTADLNALNAAMAVISWKRFCGFYEDIGDLDNNTYTIEFNSLCNRSLPCID